MKLPGAKRKTEAAARSLSTRSVNYSTSPLLASKTPAWRSRFLVALGCSGWSAGQLEKEIRENTWITCPATDAILFSTDYAKKPDMAAATLGFTMAQLTSEVGYS